MSKPEPTTCAVEEIPTISILGSRISVLPSYEVAYRTIVEYVQSTPNPGYITVNNVHTVVEAVLHPDYRRIINRAFLAFPDGQPLSMVARRKGERRISRIFGPTFMEKAFEWSQKDGITHFLFGSSPSILEHLAEKISRRFPEAKVVGMVSPPYRPFTKVENRAFIAEMNQSKADIIWVGLGAPRQERWMYENYSKLDRGVMIGIGAGFDYLAGNIKHAPEWMKRWALEWLYRLIQEPRRLWKRYLVTNSLFLLFLFLEMLHLKKFE